MSGPMYGGPKVKRDPLRAVEQRARILPGRMVERVGRQITREGRMWQDMLEDHEKDKQLLQANTRLGEMMKEWHSEWLPRFKSRVGENAVGSTGAATLQLDDILKRHGEELSPFASDHLKRRWQGFTDSELAGVAGHEAREQAKASQTAKITFGNNWLQAIAHNPHPATIEKAIKEYGGILTADLLEGDDIRDSPMLVKQMRDYTEAAWVMGIGALIDRGEVKKAEFLLEVHGTAPEVDKDKPGDPKQNAIIGPEAKSKLDELLEAKKKELGEDSTLVQEQNATDALMDRVEEEDLNKSDVRAWIRDNYKGEARERMTNRVMTRMNLRKSDKESQDRSAIDNAVEQLQGIIPPGPGPMTTAMETKLYELRKTVPAKYQLQFDTYVKQQLYNDPITPATTAAAEEWFDLSNDEIMSMSPEQVKDRFQLRVNNDVWDAIKKEHRSLTRKPEGRSWKTRRDDFVKDMFIGSDPRDLDIKDQKVALQKHMQQAYEDAVAENDGRVLNGVAQDAIIGQFSQIGTVPGFAQRLGLDELPFVGRYADTGDTPYWQTVLPGKEKARAAWRSLPLESVLVQSPALRDYIDEVFLPTFREENKREPTPTELYDHAVLMVESGELDPRTTKREVIDVFPTEHPQVLNPDGSYSNVRLMTVTFTEKGEDVTYVIPTLVGGKPFTGDEEEVARKAVAVARKHGMKKYPSFKSVPDAEEWIKANHGNVQ